MRRLFMNQEMLTITFRKENTKILFCRGNGKRVRYLPVSRNTMFKIQMHILHWLKNHLSRGIYVLSFCDLVTSNSIPCIHLILETVVDLPLNLKERALKMLNLSNMTYFQSWYKCHTPLYSTIKCKLAILNFDTTCIIIHG